MEQLLAQAEVPPAVLRGVLPRLERFLEPFVRHLDSRSHRTTAQPYVAGLLSNVKRKNAESIAYLHD
jgi:hypothetical protein